VKEQKVIKVGERLLPYAVFGLTRFLARVWESALSSSFKRTRSLVAYTPFRVIDSNYADRYRMSSDAAELVCLSLEIATNPVDLLDHRFCQYLDFDADFDIGSRRAAHQVPYMKDRPFTGNRISESPIPPSRSYSLNAIRHISHSCTRGYALRKQLRPTEDDEILKEVD